MSILLLDDDSSVLKSMERIFNYFNCKVISTDDPTEALNLLQDNEIHMVVSDYEMPLMKGTTFLQKVKQINPSVLRVLMSGISENGKDLEDFDKAEVIRYLSKPWQIEDLLELVSTLRK